MLPASERSLGTADFFGVLMPGLFLVMMLGLGLLVPLSGSIVDETVAAKDLCPTGPVLSCVVNGLGEHLVSWITVLTLIAYMFGAVFRSIPVDLATDVVARARGRSGEPFPYKSDLLACRMSVARAHGYEDADIHRLLPIPDDELSRRGLERTYNYWKSCLVNTPHVFALAQSYENRTRFFAGMFWSAAAAVVATSICLVIWAWFVGAEPARTYAAFAIGAGAAVSVLCHVWAKRRSTSLPGVLLDKSRAIAGVTWLYVVAGWSIEASRGSVRDDAVLFVAGAVILFSTGVCVAFGRRLRFVRRSEAGHVFLLYASQLLASACTGAPVSPASKDG